jgi:hypothetical protein
MPCDAGLPMPSLVPGCRDAGLAWTSVARDAMRRSTPDRPTAQCRPPGVVRMRRSHAVWCDFPLAYARHVQV